jgi:hypothetical protein
MVSSRVLASSISFGMICASGNVGQWRTAISRFMAFTLRRAGLKIAA